MPQLVYTRHSATQMLSEDLSAWIYKVARWFSDYRRYCRSVSELSDLSEHELADLGLHRSEIKRVAHGTVYGQRP